MTMSATNARKELIEFLEYYNTDILCAYVDTEDYFNELTGKRTVERHIVLKKNHTPEEYNKFLREMDFSYDNGYGGQELFGTIWFKDGTWAKRAEYDGSEWWEYVEPPSIPDELL